MAEPPTKPPIWVPGVSGPEPERKKSPLEELSEKASKAELERQIGFWRSGKPPSTDEERHAKWRADFEREHGYAPGSPEDVRKTLVEGEPSGKSSVRKDIEEVVDKLKAALAPSSSPGGGGNPPPPSAEGLEHSRGPQDAVPIETHSDRSVLGLCELLGLLFALPFGEDLYHDTPITALHVFYLVVGCVFAVTGPIWPKIKTLKSTRYGVLASIPKAASDARTWLVVLLFIFAIGIGPEVYRRAVMPDVPMTEDQKPHTGRALIVGPGDSDYVGSPLGYWWDYPTLDIRPSLNAEDKNLRIFEFDLQTKNVGAEEVKVKSAKIISGIDATELEMRISSPDGALLPKEASAIPAGAEFEFSASFGTTNGLTEADFEKTWGWFTVEVVAGDHKMSHLISKDWVQAQINRQHPERLPHASRLKQ